MVAPGQFWCSRCWSGLAHQTVQAYCPACAGNLGPHQSPNARGRCSLCNRERLPLAGVCRLGVYQDILAGAVKLLKYQGNQVVGRRLGDMLGQVLAEQEWCGRVEALCPIPIHWTRWLDRGFNQAQVLADRMARTVSRPVIRLLTRVRPTITQVGLTRNIREKNLQDAFAIRGRWPLKGTTLCLVDDVMTTGATLFEAARTLRRAGAKEIYAAVVAKAEHSTSDA